MNTARGIGLISGGLDSALACKVVMEAGADVECLHFFTGFCVTGHHMHVGRIIEPVTGSAREVAEEIGVDIDLLDISGEYLDLVLHPKHGYGANMNPCIDCREFMLCKAKEHMEQVGADFIFTGEVIGQRPMTQTRRTLDDIERRVGLKGRLLRPLSARLLPPTAVETEGRIDRKKLHDFQGRSRKPQLALAEKYGITRFQQPAGGCCFLTDKAYSRKLRDLFVHTQKKPLSMDDVYLLGVGRHFRLSPSLKIIVGRDEIENRFLENYTDRYWSACAASFPGATVLIMGEWDDEARERIASVAARYCDGKYEPSVEIRFAYEDAELSLRAAPAGDDSLDAMRI